METSSSTAPSSRGRAIAAEVKRVKRIVETFMVKCAGVVWVRGRLVWLVGGVDE
jgi:hypothetical protein